MKAFERYGVGHAEVGGVAAWCRRSAALAEPRRGDRRARWPAGSAGLADGACNSAEVVSAFEPADAEAEDENDVTAPAPVVRTKRSPGCKGSPGCRVAAATGRGFQNHVVLVELRVEGADLPLAVGVIERVVDGVGAMPSRDAVTRSIDSETARPPVCWSVATSSSSGSLFNSPTNLLVHSFNSLLIGILQRVLVLGAADAVIHRDVLHRLHVELHALDLRRLFAAGGSHRTR